MAQFDHILQAATAEIKSVENINDLYQVKVTYLGKKGKITELMGELKTIDKSKLKEYGQGINQLKSQITDLLNKREAEIKEKLLNNKINSEWLDLSLPVARNPAGKIHPIPYSINEIIKILTKLGFTLVDGPEIEDDFHNFTALNIPDYHPARAMHDSFYLEKLNIDSNDSNIRDRNDIRDHKDRKNPAAKTKSTDFKIDSNSYAKSNANIAADTESNSGFNSNANSGYLNDNLLFRTHTSSVQIRTMQQGKAPFKIVSLGKTYRADSDKTHTPMFHQLEALYIDKNINIGHMKYCIFKFLEEFFQIEDMSIRFRSSYFPFTEPSAEVDMGYHIEDKAIQIGGDDKFLEVMGCGMVHPKVLENVNIDPREYQGFAFGAGIERLVMLKYGITDLRNFFLNDQRWLSHYGFSFFS